MLRGVIAASSRSRCFSCSSKKQIRPIRGSPIKIQSRRPRQRIVCIPKSRVHEMKQVAAVGDFLFGSQRLQEGSRALANVSFDAVDGSSTGTGVPRLSSVNGARSSPVAWPVRPLAARAVAGQCRLSGSLRVCPETSVGIAEFRGLSQIKARHGNASAVRLRFPQSLASLRQQLSPASETDRAQQAGVFS
jgi:hypothetical protein